VLRLFSQLRSFLGDFSLAIKAIWAATSRNSLGEDLSMRSRVTAETTLDHRQSPSESGSGSAIS